MGAKTAPSPPRSGFRGIPDWAVSERLRSPRELDEIISIAHSTTEEWVSEIRELAKRELIRRNVSLEMQNEIINKWNQDLQEWLTNNSTESYSKWEMIKIIILAPA